ncbi:aminotransferase class IV [Zavarzinia aquatilis]|uniref:Probable branched-chain-amino-acid aminotransferase n=1 Tax=Zavarzinia aquatilis TaxID=2211142 RepID=A0A317DYD9_9PROT|nr:aminotransferase class IV [Zavarzinia aquatilis]PWR19492.1 branched-chain amino acid transferase [Zavarzinia aquatilis]
MNPSNSPPDRPADNAFDQGVAWLDGHFVPLSEARISVFDHGFTRSDATYDVAHVYRRRVFRLDRHIARFMRSLKSLRFEIPFDSDGLRALLLEAVRQTALDDAWIMMICTRGRPPFGSRDIRLCRNNLIVCVVPFIWLATPAQREAGLTATVSTLVRIPPHSVDPRVKNFHWLDFVRSIFEAQERGSDLAFLCGEDGRVTEGAGFNVFMVKGGEVLTPADGVLEGITRASVLDICADEGVPARVAVFDAAALRAADEIFVTTTSGGIVPVVRLDDRPIGDGRPGPVTRKLNEIYWRRHESAPWSEPIDI